MWGESVGGGRVWGRVWGRRAGEMRIAVGFGGVGEDGSSLSWGLLLWRECVSVCELELGGCRGGCRGMCGRLSWRLSWDVWVGVIVVGRG